MIASVDAADGMGALRAEKRRFAYEFENRSLNSLILAVRSGHAMLSVSQTAVRPRQGYGQGISQN